MWMRSQKLLFQVVIPLRLFFFIIIIIFCPGGFRYVQVNRTLNHLTDESDGFSTSEALRSCTSFAKPPIWKWWDEKSPRDERAESKPGVICQLNWRRWTDWPDCSEGSNERFLWEAVSAGEWRRNMLAPSYSLPLLACPHPPTPSSPPPPSRSLSELKRKPVSALTA